MLPQLRRLERQYHDEVAVIGVHSPKFTAEQDPENLRAAVLALEVDHAVVGDPDHLTWNQYAVRAWPTLMFVDPRGQVFAKHEGELHFPVLGEVVGRMLDQYRADGSLGRGVSTVPLHPESRTSNLLAFPAAVTADEPSGRLVVSDSGHHRLLVCRMGGAAARVERVIGAGVAGYTDGDSDACFDAPRGAAIDGDSLYVADSGNHALRRVDLATGRVSTLAGTGKQAARFHRGGVARELALSSPWDLALSADRRTLYIAMAGFHQIWALKLDSGEIGPFAGTGHEGIKDEARTRAWHAQPYGLWLDSETLYVADSETSAVRAIDTAGADGAVRTLCGSGLFDFGDSDGPGGAALMQHTSGLCVYDGALWVVDAYNNKLRKIDLTTGWVATAAGNGAHGFADGVGELARLWDPSNLTAAWGKLYIADTNNHAIRIFDPASGELSTLDIRE